jgi:O-antigen ligase
MKLLVLLLDLLLVVLPFGALLRFQLFSEVFFYPHDIILGTIFLLIFYLFYKKRKIPEPKPIFYSLGAFLIFCFISLILNVTHLEPVQFLVAFLYLFRLVIYSSVLFMFGFLSKEAVGEFLKKLAMSSFIFVLLGIGQYFFYNDLGPFKVFNWDIHKDRLFGSVLDPNFAGAIIIIEIFLLLHFYTGKIKKNVKLFLSISLFISLLALFLTYSRSTYIAFAISGIAFFVLTKNAKLLYSAVIFIVAAIFLIPKNFSVEGMNLLRTGSIVGRLESFSDSFSVFLTSPIFGVGFNAYRYAQFRLGLLDVNWLATHAGAGVSNSYLFILATTGVIGILLFLFFLYRLFHVLIENRKRNSALVNFTITILIGILVHSLFDNTFFYSFVMVWLFMLIGATVSKDKN